MFWKQGGDLLIFKDAHLCSQFYISIKSTNEVDKRDEMGKVLKVTRSQMILNFNSSKSDRNTYGLKRGYF